MKDRLWFRNSLRKWLIPGLVLLFLGACHPPPPPGTIRVLCFGDSVTEGVGAASGEDYPSVLATLIEQEVINEGVSGEITEEGLNRLPGVLENESPNLVILCEGGNDILRHKDISQVRDNLIAMIDECKRHGAAVIFIGVPRPSIPLRTAPLYGQVAGERNVFYMKNVLTDILADRRFKADMIHPNAKGYKRLAEKIAKAIPRAMAAI